MSGEAGRRGGRVRRACLQVGVVVLGVALGLGATALYRARTGPQRRPVPSATRFSFATPARLPGVSAPVDATPAPENEPADPAAALSAFLDAEAAGRPQASWALLDAEGHRRWPTAASWAAAAAERPLPVSFQLAGPPALPADESVDMAVEVNRRPALDAFRGLVAARSTERWRVHREDGRWRVAATPVESRPVLPPDDAAPPAVQAWLDRLLACDAAGAAGHQIASSLLGPADLVAGPCQRRGTWTAGAPVTIDRGGDAQGVLAAYGPGATSWARSVRVQGPDRSFWAEVAPVGDRWTVVGVAAGG